MEIPLSYNKFCDVLVIKFNESIAEYSHACAFVDSFLERLNKYRALTKYFNIGLNLNRKYNKTTLTDRRELNYHTSCREMITYNISHNDPRESEIIFQDKIIMVSQAVLELLLEESLSE
ncbi:MAG: hypothetical protein JKX76_02125 [Colwellia sp.]|nr:hypothetical protein [Colwellia sp.]